MLKANDFIPLDNRAPYCCIGYSSTATAPDLYDTATLRHSAALGVLRVLSDHHSLAGLDAASLHNCIQAVLILSEDASALYAGAWQTLQNE